MDDNEFDKWQKKLFIAVFFAVVGGNAGSFLNAVRPDIRADPFTGTEGRELEHRIDILESGQSVIQFRLEKKHQDIMECQKHIEKLEDRCRQHEK